MKLNSLTALFGAGVVLGCQPDMGGFAERVTTPAERKFAADYLAMLTALDTNQAFTLLIPSLQNDEVRQQLVASASVLAAHPPESLSIIGVQLNSMGGTRSVNLSWEYPSGSEWVVTNVAARHSSSGLTQVEGFSVQLFEQSLRELNAFTLQDRSPVHFFWLIAVIVMPLLCLGAAARLATAKGMPKRWLWTAFALVGVSRMSLNWTTGQVGISTFYVSLLAAGATKVGPAAPWILTFAFPLGAALGLIKYRQWRRSQSDAVSAANLRDVAS